MKDEYKEDPTNPPCPKCKHDDSRKYTHSFMPSVTSYVCPNCHHRWDVMTKEG